ncbi:MAG: phosphoglycerate dehydrogenase [Planctomycetota bacterium]
MRILLTTTSYQDTPGPHHDALDASGFEVVRARGPLSESEMLGLIAEQASAGGGFDGLLNGDDEITAKVIDAALAAPTPLRVIAKYGIGLDSIDVAHATKHKIPVLFTPGVNHTTVAEHAFGLMIGLAKHFKMHLREVEAGRWKRQTGTELAGKTLGIVGMGRIGKEVIKRGAAFDMPAIAYDLYWDDDFAGSYGVKRCDSAEQVLTQADVISLHMNLTDENRGFINTGMIAQMKDTAILINTARGGLVVEQDVADACRDGRLGGYGTDVVNVEPLQPPHPYQGVDNIMLTPHIGSRTTESVGRQAMRATQNLVNFLRGDPDFIQANPFD